MRIHRNKDLLPHCISYCLSIMGHVNTNHLDCFLHNASYLRSRELRSSSGDEVKQHSPNQCNPSAKSYNSRPLYVSKRQHNRSWYSEQYDYLCFEINFCGLVAYLLRKFCQHHRRNSIDVRRQYIHSRWRNIFFYLSLIKRNYVDFVEHFTDRHRYAYRSPASIVPKHSWIHKRLHDLYFHCDSDGV